MCNFGLIALCCSAAFMGTVMAHASLGVLVWASHTGRPAEG